jgi:hypothetical protein
VSAGRLLPTIQHLKMMPIRLAGEHQLVAICCLTDRASGLNQAWFRFWALFGEEVCAPGYRPANRKVSRHTNAFLALKPASGECFMDDHKNYHEKYQKQIDNWKQEVHVLKERMHAAKDDASVQMKAIINDLGLKIQEADVKLEEMRAAGEMALESKQKEIEASWAAIKKYIGDTLTKFKD